MASIESAGVPASVEGVERERSRRLLLRALTAVPFLAVLGWIARLRPYYGPMDDATLLRLRHWIWSPSYWTTWWSATRGDVSSWGMVRPFYWALAQLEYAIGGTDPLALFTLNWLVTSVILLVAGVVMARVFVVPEGRRPLFLAVYAVAVIGFPWTLDLYAFPSLQEKWVILAAAIGFWWFSEARAGSRALTWYAVSAAVIVGGSLTKAQFVVFLPGFALLAFDVARERRSSLSRPVFVVGLSVLAAAALRVVASFGSYTASFGLGNVGTQLHSKYLWLFVVLGALWSAYVLRARRTSGSKARELVPLVVLVTFIVVFLQWNSFLFSVISFVAASSFALLVSRLEQRGIVAAVVGIALVSALGWSYVRGDELFGSLSSIGQFSRSTEIRRLAAAHATVYVSCSEGSHAFVAYAQRETGVTVRFGSGGGPAWSVAKGTPPPQNVDWAFVDPHMCPAAIDLSAWTAVWRPSRAGGFTLYRRLAR